jgi:hypothetical protein
MLKQKIEFVSNEIEKLNDVTKAMESYIKLKNDSTSVLLKPHINNLSSVACSVMPVLKEIDRLLGEIYENNNKTDDLINEIYLIKSSFESLSRLMEASAHGLELGEVSGTSGIIDYQLEKLSKKHDMIYEYNNKNRDMIHEISMTKKN